MRFLTKLKSPVTLLTLAAFSIQFAGIAVIAQKSNVRKEVSAIWNLAPKNEVQRGKIAPDLEENADQVFHGLRADATQKVIIQLRSDAPVPKTSSDDTLEDPKDALSDGNENLVDSLRSDAPVPKTASDDTPEDPKEALIDPSDEADSNKAKTGILVGDLTGQGGRLNKAFYNLGLVSAELPLSKIRELSEKDEVAYISADQTINPTGHVNNTTGADLVRAQTNSSGGSYTLDGTGIGIAIIDSGMYSGHNAFKNAAGATRIKFSKDFTGENRTDDPFGHGTHVATAAAGYRVAGTSGNRYEGIAWNANLINLRVLNARGTGTTSGLLSALSWVLANKATYNIRVANLSLGTPAIGTYTSDPLCVAVRSLVNAGIVVVAAAGNDGRNSLGQKQYGTIHSPGNEPSAITVGASNTFGTDSRYDDIVTTYSSRGPTRSYFTDTSGVKHYDNLIKPDLVAPGNKLIFGESDSNLIITNYPNLDAIWSQRPGYRFMYLSGSSMSTPITAGAAALLLQVNPNLRPNMVKMILTYTAQQLPNYNMLEQGAGQLNIEGAVRLAKAIKTTLPSGTALGTPMMATTVPPIPISTVGGSAFPWAQGIIFGQTYGKSSELITKYQKVYDLGVLMSDGTKLSTSGVLISDTTRMTSGVLIGDNIMKSNGVLIGDGTVFMSTSQLLGNGVLLADRTILGDGVLISDGVLIADGVLIGDNIDPSGVLINGDNTAYMLP